MMFGLITAPGKFSQSVALVQPLSIVGGLLAALWYLRISVFHALDVALAWARGLPKLREKNAYLKGLYAPTDVEATHEDLPIAGSMPRALEGVYCRVGPNPYLRPTGNYHWFDGDGMTHVVRIKNGKASYANRYVETHRLKTERNAGYPLYEKIGDSAGAGYLAQMLIQKAKKALRVIDASKGAGRANTALVYHCQRLLVLEEGDLPYALRVLCNGVVETLGRANWGGKLQHAFTAHPKKDPVTGELFAFGYNISQQPHATFTKIDANGDLVRDVPVSLPQGVMMHDCALTEKYFIFLDNPLVFSPERIVKDGSLPFWFDKSCPSRFGLTPRNVESEKEIRWFELPAMMIFHTANAWQEGPDIVKMAACCFDEFELDIGSAHFRTPAHMPRMHILTFDLATGHASRQRVAPIVGDFPVVPARLIGRKTRYAYLATMPEDGDAPGFSGVTKLDLQASNEADAVVGQISYPSGWEGGEAYFVPSDATNGHSLDEDDGYLCTFMMHEGDGASKFAVFDAKTMSAQPLATVAIPCRVPAGFHGLHVKEAELATQA